VNRQPLPPAGTRACPPTRWSERGGGITRMVRIGTDAPSRERAAGVAGGHPRAEWATVGLHPHHPVQGVDRRPARCARCRTSRACSAWTAP